MKISRNFALLAFISAPALAVFAAPAQASEAKSAKPSAAASAAAPPHQKGNEMSQIFTTPVKTIDGKETNLSEYKGKVLLIVNTASQCGFTPQYKGLEALYEKYKGQGFEVLGFPSNDFGGQEPGSEAEIKKFCELKYKTSFPMFAKVSVKDHPHPLYALLQKEGNAIVGWNFGKFLIGRDGTVKHYYASKVTPESNELESAVEAALHESK